MKNIEIDPKTGAPIIRSATAQPDKVEPKPITPLTPLTPSISSIPLTPTPVIDPAHLINPARTGPHDEILKDVAPAVRSAVEQVLIERANPKVEFAGATSVSNRINKLKQIHSILANGGMDTQQQNHALQQIREVLGW